MELEYVTLLVTLLLLASLDSINPCAMSMTAAVTLASSSLGLGGSRALRYPFSFILGVYLGYVLLGFIASWILRLSPILLLLAIVAALILALLDLREAFSERALACRVGECAPPWFRVLPHPSTLVLLAVSGALVSWSFMLCSAAPYLVFLSILSQSVEHPILRLPFILLYCLVVVAPLVVIAIAPLLLLERVAVSYRVISLVRAFTLIIVALIGSYYMFLVLRL